MSGLKKYKVWNLDDSHNSYQLTVESNFIDDMKSIQKVLQKSDIISSEIVRIEYPSHVDFEWDCNLSLMRLYFYVSKSHIYVEIRNPVSNKIHMSFILEV